MSVPKTTYMIRSRQVVEMRIGLPGEPAFFVARGRVESVEHRAELLEASLGRFYETIRIDTSLTANLVGADVVPPTDESREAWQRFMAAEKAQQ